MRIVFQENDKVHWNVQQILNKDECGVAQIGVTIGGKLFYRNSLSLVTHTDISHVVFIRSRKVKGYKFNQSVEADFDVYLEDGRVVEVWSCVREVLQAASKLAPEPDPRARFRQARGYKPAYQTRRA